MKLKEAQKVRKLQTLHRLQKQQDRNMRRMDVSLRGSSSQLQSDYLHFQAGSRLTRNQINSLQSKGTNG